MYSFMKQFGHCEALLHCRNTIGCDTTKIMIRAPFCHNQHHFSQHYWLEYGEKGLDGIAAKYSTPYLAFNQERSRF